MPSYCDRNFYVLPADKCVEAASLYRLAREDALRAKKEVWKEKYGAAGAVTGGGDKDRALFWSDFGAMAEQMRLGGFSTNKKRILVDGQEVWVVKPNRSTARGKSINAALEYVEEMLRIWEWSLEKALGIDGTVFHDRAFHKTRARLLKDGRVIVSAPEDKNRPNGPGYSRNFEASKIPDWAVPITQAEHDRLAEDADRYEATEETV